MQNRITFLIGMLLLSATISSKAQYTRADSTYKKYFTGSTFFVLGNFGATNRPDFAQINMGYRLSGKDAVSLELKTWKYAWSLGIPFGKSFQAPDEEFPGFIREFGFAIVYQHFWWKGFYNAIHVMSAWQRFVSNTNPELIVPGFQIFNTYRMGYHFKFFNGIFFIEPSVAITHRAFHTAMPNSFKQLDDKWPKFFYGEPGLHFGFNF